MSEDNTIKPQLLKLAEAAKMLSIHPDTLREWEKQGLITAIRIGTRKDRRYKLEDIEKFIERNKNGQD